MFLKVVSKVVLTVLVGASALVVMGLGFFGIALLSEKLGISLEGTYSTNPGLLVAVLGAVLICVVSARFGVEIAARVWETKKNEIPKAP